MKKILLACLCICFLILILYGYKSNEIDVVDLSETEIDNIAIIYGAGSYEVRITDKKIIKNVVSAYNDLVFKAIDANQSDMDILTELTITFDRKKQKPIFIFVDASGIFSFEDNKKYMAVSGELFYDTLLRIYKDNS